MELASSWLIVRFIDQKAEVLFADEKEIDQKISETMAVPLSIPGVEFSDDSKKSAFDKLLFSYRFNNPALTEMAKKIKDCDLSKLTMLFVQSGIPENEIKKSFGNPQEIFAHAISLYDSLYVWIKSQPEVTNLQSWEPKTTARKQI